MTAMANKGTVAAARALATSLTQTLSAPGLGRPAPKGQPPRKQTGALVRAVGVARGPDGSVRVGIVDSAQQTKAKALAARRPYLAPTVRRTRSRLMGEFTRGARR